MAAVLVEVADAVAAALNGHDFGVVFKAERSFADWNDTLSALKDVKVDVVPHRDEPTTEDVGNYVHEVTIDILIRKKFEGHELEQGDGPDGGRPMLSVVDPWFKFSQDVWEFLARQQPGQATQLATAGGLEAAWDANTTRMMAPWIVPHMRRQQQFTSWFRIGYTVTKPVG